MSLSEEDLKIAAFDKIPIQYPSGPWGAITMTLTILVPLTLKLTVPCKIWWKMVVCFKRRWLCSKDRYWRTLTKAISDPAEKFSFITFDTKEICVYVVMFYGSTSAALLCNIWVFPLWMSNKKQQGYMLSLLQYLYPMESCNLQCTAGLHVKLIWIYMYIMHIYIRILPR